MSCQKCGSTDTYCGCDEATAIAERDAALAELAALKKRLADAPRTEVFNGAFGDVQRPMVAEDVLSFLGDQVALVRLEDGE